MVESFEEIVELSLLFDFYGELLTEHQKQIYEDHVLNDLSVSEIAADRGAPSTPPWRGLFYFFGIKFARNLVVSKYLFNFE